MVRSYVKEVNRVVYIPLEDWSSDTVAGTPIDPILPHREVES